MDDWKWCEPKHDGIAEYVGVVAAVLGSDTRTVGDIDTERTIVFEWFDWHDECEIRSECAAFWRPSFGGPDKRFSDYELHIPHDSVGLPSTATEISICDRATVGSIDGILLDDCF